MPFSSDLLAADADLARWAERLEAARRGYGLPLDLRAREEGLRACAEGLLVGISSGAALAAVAQKLPNLLDGARVLTFCYDTGERYLSVEGLF